MHYVVYFKIHRAGRLRAADARTKTLYMSSSHTTKEVKVQTCQALLPAHELLCLGWDRHTVLIEVHHIFLFLSFEYWKSDAV